MPVYYSSPNEKTLERLDAKRQLTSIETNTMEFKKILERTFEGRNKEEFKLLNSEDLNELYLDLFRASYLQIAETGESNESKISQEKLAVLENHMKYDLHEVAKKARSRLFDEILNEEKEEIRDKKIVALLNLVRKEDGRVEVEEKIYQKVALVSPHRLLEFHPKPALSEIIRAMERLKKSGYSPKQDSVLEQLDYALLERLKENIRSSMPAGSFTNRLNAIKNMNEIRTFIIEAMNQEESEIAKKILKKIHDPYLAHQILQIDIPLFDPNNNKEVTNVLERFKDSLKNEAQLANRAMNGDITAIEDKKLKISNAHNGKGMLMHVYGYLLSTDTAKEIAHHKWIEDRSFIMQKTSKHYQDLIELKEFFIANLKEIKKQKRDKYKDLDLSVVILLFMRENNVKNNIVTRFEKSLISFMEKEQHFHEAQINEIMDRKHKLVDQFSRSAQAQEEKESPENQKKNIHYSVEVLLKKYGYNLDLLVKQEGYSIPFIAQYMIELLKNPTLASKEIDLKKLLSQRDPSDVNLNKQLEQEIMMLSQSERDNLFRLHPNTLVVLNQLQLLKVKPISPNIIIEAILQCANKHEHRFPFYQKIFLNQNPDIDSMVSLVTEAFKIPNLSEDKLLMVLETVSMGIKDKNNMKIFMDRLSQKWTDKNIQAIKNYPYISDDLLELLSYGADFRHYALRRLFEKEKNIQERPNEVLYLKALLEPIIQNKDKYEEKSDEKLRLLQTEEVATVLSEFLKKTTPYDHSDYYMIQSIKMIMEANINELLAPAIKERLSQKQIDAAFQHYQDYHLKNSLERSNHIGITTMNFLLSCGVSSTQLLRSIELNSASYFKYYFNELIKIKLDQKQYITLANKLIDYLKSLPKSHLGDWSLATIFLNNPNVTHTPEVLRKILIVAIKANQTDIAKQFIAAGVSLSSPDAQGKIPWDYADESQKEILLELYQQNLETMPIKVLKYSIVHSPDKETAQKYLTEFFSREPNRTDLEFDDQTDAIIQSYASGNWWLVELLSEQPTIDKKLFGKFLLDATIHEQTDVVQKLLQHNVTEIWQDKESNTPLHYAISRNNEDLLKLLLEAGHPAAKKNYRGETPLSIAIIQRKTNLATILLTETPHYHPVLDQTFGQYFTDKTHYKNYLYLAIQYNNFDIVQLLLNNEDIVPTQAELSFAKRLEDTNPEIIKLLTIRVSNYEEKRQLDTLSKLIESSSISSLSELRKPIITAYETDKIYAMRLILQSIMKENDSVHAVRFINELLIKNPLNFKNEQLKEILKPEHVNGDTLLHWLFSSENKSLEHLSIKEKLYLIHELTTLAGPEIAQLNNKNGFSPALMAQIKGETFLVRYFNSNNKRFFYVHPNFDSLLQEDKEENQVRRYTTSVLFDKLEISNPENIQFMIDHYPYNAGKKMLMEFCKFVITEEIPKTSFKQLITSELMTVFQSKEDRSELLSLHRYLDNKRNKNEMLELKKRYPSLDPLTLIWLQMERRSDEIRVPIEKAALEKFLKLVDGIMRDELGFDIDKILGERTRRLSIIQSIKAQMNEPSAPLEPPSYEQIFDEQIFPYDPDELPPPYYQEEKKGSPIENIENNFDTDKQPFLKGADAIPPAPISVNDSKDKDFDTNDLPPLDNTAVIPRVDAVPSAPISEAAIPIPSAPEMPQIPLTREPSYSKVQIPIAHPVSDEVVIHTTPPETTTTESPSNINEIKEGPSIATNPSSLFQAPSSPKFSFTDNETPEAAAKRLKEKEDKLIQSLEGLKADQAPNAEQDKGKDKEKPTIRKTYLG